MSGIATGTVGFLALLALIALRVPIAIALAVVGMVGATALNGWASVGFMLGSIPFETVFPYSLSVVPLFVMMGVFAARAGLSTALYRAVNSLIGHRPGGLASATIGACAAFGAICGSSLATAATMCRVALPEMRRHGYDDRLAAGAIAAGGTLGVLIPPSIILVVYALLTEQSIGKLFAAALIPGVVGTGLYMLAVWLQTRRNPALGPAGERVDWRGRGVHLWHVWPVALLFVVVMGGIYLGWFSPTEAAAVGAFGTVVLAAARRQLSRAVLAECLAETASITAMIFMILIGTGIFNLFIESTGLPHALAGQVAGLGWHPLAVLVLLMVFYIVLGCFMDSLSMVFVTVPFIFPLVVSLGFDPLWFGILLVTVVEISLITPPIGMNLFVIKAVAEDLSWRTTVRGVGPFLAADAVRLAILVAFPALALWLPSLMR